MQNLTPKTKSEKAQSWAEVLEYTRVLTKIGKHFGLLKEFRENGII